MKDNKQDNKAPMGALLVKHVLNVKHFYREKQSRY